MRALGVGRGLSKAIARWNRLPRKGQAKEGVGNIERKITAKAGHLQAYPVM